MWLSPVALGPVGEVHSGGNINVSHEAEGNKSPSTGRFYLNLLLTGLTTSCSFNIWVFKGQSRSQL